MGVVSPVISVSYVLFFYFVPLNRKEIILLLILIRIDNIKQKIEKLLYSYDIWFRYSDLGTGLVVK